METRMCDVLVIGGGETGIRAAVEAKRSGAEQVLLLTKGKFGSAGVMFSELTYGWDMQAATGENDRSDSTDSYLQDVLNGAQGVCSPTLARIVTEESPDRVRDLVDLFHLELVTNKDGKPRQVYGCFSSKNRSYQFTHPAQIKENMKDSIQHYQIELLEQYMAVHLICQDGICRGAVALSKRGEPLCCLAGATILAAGGATGIYQHNFASAGMTGDGYCLAYQAGCTLANLEFMQFGLGVLAPKYKALFLDRLLYLHPQIKFQREHRFPRPLDEMMTQHAKHFPFSCSDDSYHLDVAIFQETLENNGQGVAVDISNIPMEKLEEIPVWELYYNWFEPERNPYDHEMRITPFAHACNGGVKIGAGAETELPGLYAAGEMVSGPHGANRPGGHMHAACQVFGTRAGRNAAHYAQAHPPQPLTPPAIELSRTEGERIDFRTLRRHIGALMWRNVNVVRNGPDMASALHAVQDYQQTIGHCRIEPGQAWDYYETRSTLLSAQLILSAALARQESRGSHYREDFPQTEAIPYVVKLKQGTSGVTVEIAPSFD